jgi:hypothetical protein
MSTAQKTPFDLPSLTLLLDLANGDFLPHAWMAVILTRW